MITGFTMKSGNSLCPSRHIRRKSCNGLLTVLHRAKSYGYRCGLQIRKQLGSFSMKLRRYMFAASAVGLAVGALSPAYAQNQTKQEPVAAEEEQEESSTVENTSEAAAAEEGTILVTGSRIRRDTFSSIEPITLITSEEITQSGFNSATDALQSLEVTAGAGQINNFFAGFVTAGGTGANTLGLRNLGPARTLVLLNGRRVAPAGTRGSVLGRVDKRLQP